MGTEKRLYTIDVYRCIFIWVKLNNPQMGTETSSKSL